MELEEELINDFNALIKEYAEEWYPHLIDTDDNSGERFRDKITEAISQAETRAYEKGKAEERERVADAFKKWQPLIRDHTRCPNIGSCIGYQNAESDFDNERENFLSLINDNK